MWCVAVAPRQEPHTIGFIRPPGAANFFMIQTGLGLVSGYTAPITSFDR